MVRVCQVLALVLLCTGSTAAQSIYAAGALGVDISLVSGQESIGITAPSGGESLSGAARLGTVLNDRFGVELEVSRAAEVHEETRPGINPLASLFPTFLPEVDSRTRITTISTTASIRQQVGDNVALAYLGGVVFHRTDTRIDYRATRGILPAGGIPGIFTVGSGREPIFPVGLALPSFSVDSVQYGVGPVVGIDAHIGYGDHLSIIPGFRMHGLPNAWLLRPAVAVGWTF